MLHTVNITDKIHYIGVNDRETHLFENLWPLDKGVSYNTYLINDEKVAIIDTVKHTKMEEFLEKIHSIIGDKPVDYLIIHHMEPDHSGAISALKEKYPNLTIVGNKKTFGLIESFYQPMEPYLPVDDGDTLNLGTLELVFYMTPMVHWPETMMSYVKEVGMLFSGDAFGGFGSLDGGIFDDEINLEFYTDEIRRYYSNIVAKYGAMVQKALKKLQGAQLDIKFICSTHGPIWRTNPNHIIALYDQWSKYEAEEGVVIVYGSMYGHTQKMADYLARRLADQGITNIRIYDASKTHVSYIISDMFRFKGIILGSCAYNAGLFPSMETVIHKIENCQIKPRPFGIFGTYSWSGGGVSSLVKFAEKMKWEVLADPVEANASPKADDFSKLDALAEAMAAQLKA